LRPPTESASSQPHFFHSQRSATKNCLPLPSAYLQASPMTVSSHLCLLCSLHHHTPPPRLNSVFPQPLVPPSDIVYSHLGLPTPVCHHSSSCLKTFVDSQVWWHRPVISALQRLRQKDLGFKASLGYIARPCLKRRKKKKKKIYIYIYIYVCIYISIYFIWDQQSFRTGTTSLLTTPGSAHNRCALHIT
jgi:hypothetical protein